MTGLLKGYKHLDGETHDVLHAEEDDDVRSSGGPDPGGHRGPPDLPMGAPALNAQDVCDVKHREAEGDRCMHGRKEFRSLMDTITDGY